jgi:hypothetical protein
MDFIGQARDWLGMLNTAQLIVFAALALGVVLVLSLVYIWTTTIWRAVRLWIRRHRIPKDIDLHLDQDEAPSRILESKRVPYSNSNDKQILLKVCLGDKKQMKRLIAHEKGLDPSLSKSQAISQALARFQRDGR